MRCMLFALCIFAVLSSCAREKARTRVIVLGLDGLDPHVVDLLVSEGKMPNFAKLRREGAYAPLLSPVVWTTIATGRTPDQHRIGHFVAIDQSTGEQLPVTSRMRATKAVWNILSEREREVAVVGWWATWPAELVRGSIVTDHLAYHFLFAEGLQPSASGGTVYPESLAREIAPMVRRPQDLTMKDLAPYVRVDASELAKPIDLRDELSHFRWAANLSAATFTDASLAGVVIKKVHVTELRTALDQALAALALAPASYTDSVITQGGTPVRAAHRLEIRAATQ